MNGLYFLGQVLILFLAIYFNLHHYSQLTISFFAGFSFALFVKSFMK